MSSKKKALERWKKDFNLAKSGLRKQYDETRACLAFYAGDWMNYRDDITIKTGARTTVRGVQFNRVKPYVNSMVGFAAQNRKRIAFEAKIDAAKDIEAYNDAVNSFADYLRENANADQVETQQDKDLFINGYGAIDTAITFNSGYASRDPNGELLMERVHPLHIGWDPHACAPNLIDSRFVYRAKDYDRDEAEDLFDRKEFEDVPPDDDNGFSYNPYGGIQDKISEGYEYADQENNLIRVYFYQFYEIENYYRVNNPILIADRPELIVAIRDAMELVTQDDDDDLFSFDPKARKLCLTNKNLKEMQDIFESFELPWDRPEKYKRKVFYTAVISGDIVFSVDKSTSQQGFSIKFKTGDWNDNEGIWTGIVSSMKDPVRYYNKALTEIMLIIASNSKGGAYVEEDAVDDIQRFEKQYARKDSVVVVKSGTLAAGKIQDKARPHMESGYEGVLQVTDKSINDVTGIDPVLFGVTGGGNETAMLQRQRIKQVVTTLATYFDAIGLYQKEFGRMILSYMRLIAEQSPDLLYRVVGENGAAQYERLKDEYFVDEYNIVITEGAEAVIQKEAYAEVLTSIGDKLALLQNPAALNVYAMAIKYLPIDTRDKMELQEMIKTPDVDPNYVAQLEGQLQAMQGQMAQLEASKRQADIMFTQAKTESELSSIELDKIKAAKEAAETQSKNIENALVEKMGGLVSDININL